ncbi:MAG: PqqD family protein [Bacteroidaceae bacterium]|nr:PqqD family protein [Bacteroidaceae bacterium]MBR3757550.1 PqqD family protein [Bacteroidaceae bacterium]
MKIKSMYKVRQVAGENLVVGQGRLNADMTKVISLNDTAALLWKELAGRDFTCEDAADVLVATYEIEKEQAMADAAKWIEKMQACGIIE